MKKSLLICAALLLAPLLLVRASPVDAGEQEAERFERAWSRLDRPVASQAAARTWVWGPEPLTAVLNEPADYVPAGVGSVQYFDKGRMQFVAEEDIPGVSDTPLSGRLVAELISGSVQVGAHQFTGGEPATAVVVGDDTGAASVTYATLSTQRMAPPFEEAAPVDTLLKPDGSLETDPELAGFGVTAGVLVEATNHRVAAVFWEFLNSSGPVWDGVAFPEEPLFPEPLALTGNPLTEAYWVEASVAGVGQLVLVQCFESRCMTYTPSNPVNWQLEFNNAGAHYLEWREGLDDTPAPEPTPDPPADLPLATFDTGAGDGPTMTLEVAATPSTRQCGLMHRDELPDDTGMLFVFEEDSVGGFWNCNTFVALTLAWIDADGVILGLSDMQPQVRGEPQNPVTTLPPAPYRYVIEANQGWFAAHGVEVGDHVDLAAAIAAGDTGSGGLCAELGLECN